MSTAILEMTEYQIDRAVESRNVQLMEKETLFVLNNLVASVNEVYSATFDFVKAERVRLKVEPQVVFASDYVNDLKGMLDYSARIYAKSVDAAEIKVKLDSWFYDVTDHGFLVYGYNHASLVSMTEAASYLGISRSMVYKYVERGLEVVGAKGSQKIPRVVLEAWKNPAYAVQMQWNYQVKKARTQTTAQRLDTIQRQIGEFERTYRGTFQQRFGRLSAETIDGRADAVDIHDWKDFEDEKQRLLDSLDQQH